jgi:hypothetical protein
MGYVSVTDLEALGRSPQGLKKGHLLQMSKVTADLSIYLAHCHMDGEAVKGLRILLGDLSPIKLFLDFDESEAPRVTGRESADKVKATIASLDYFLILGTDNALTTRWVPWEVGVAESVKPLDHILFMPVADVSGQFRSTDYLQLYQTIERSRDGRYAIFPATGSVSGPRAGPLLDKWLTARAKK